MTERQVRRVAELARLQLTDQETALYAQQLGKFLAHARQLQDPREPCPMGAPEGGTMGRRDRPRRSGMEEAILANAPRRRGDLFAAPLELHQPPVSDDTPGDDQG